ncbi:serine/threonine-protein kinase [Nocardiopsis rhodophaea]|uniref:serine/threonine-protein kinase n=1 Tax=Nocardiopsis rhodophaea TaxID=280238 RepID=UPI0031D46DA7
MADPIRDGDPRQVGPYRLHHRLGGGGMGQVFLGRSPGGRTVAVKVVRPELADDAEFRRRFASEVKAAREVPAFYTAPVVDADPDADPPWLATAYIPGPSLHQAVDDHGPLSTVSVAFLGAGLAEGLAAVHASRLVHRDLKPGNVILAVDGPRLIDFGIARAMDTTSFTRSRTVMGTAAFMSPEQASGESVGPPSDVFSLGCVLTFAATGRSPFGQGPVHAVVYRVVHADPDLSGLPDSLVGLVRACLDKEPAARPGLETVLEELTTLAPLPPDGGHGEGRWWPEELTDVIPLRRTRVLEPEPLKHPPASEDANTGPGAKLDPPPSRPGAATAGTTDLRHAAEAGNPAAMNSLALLLMRDGHVAEAEEWWRRASAAGNTDAMRNLDLLSERPPAQGGPDRAASGQASLTVGNIGPTKMQVIVDGTELGTVTEGRRETFPVTPGAHDLQVRCGEYRSALRRIEAKADVTTRMAFNIPNGGDAVPEPVEEVTFRQDTARLALVVAVGMEALVVAFFALVLLFVFAVVAVMKGVGEAVEEFMVPPGPFLSVIVGGFLAFPVILGIYFLLVSEARLSVSREGITFVPMAGPTEEQKERSIMWLNLDQVSLVEDGNTLKLVVWPRTGCPRPDGDDFQGGVVVCTGADVDADDETIRGRLRAALRWFADYRWVEQPE